MGKKSFILHIDSLDILDDLTDQQVCDLFRAIKSHQNGEEVELSPMVKIAFSPFKNQFMRDDEKYTQTCKKRAEAGSKGGKQKVANASNSKQKVTNQANLADSDSKNDSDSDSKNKRERKIFKPPTMDELKSYIAEKNYQVNADLFFNHYETNGWKVGKNKMANWKAAIASWHNRNKSNETNDRVTKRNLTAIERVEAACKKREAEVADNGQYDIPALGSHDKNIRT